MAGYLPQGRGNKTTNRTGSNVSRKLKAAGFNISPAARKYRYEGIFVSAQGDHVSVMVDLGRADRNLALGNQIAEFLVMLDCCASPVNVHRTEGLDSVRVSFTHAA